MAAQKSDFSKGDARNAGVEQVKARLRIPGRLQTTSMNSTTQMHVHCLLMQLGALLL